MEASRDRAPGTGPSALGLEDLGDLVERIRAQHKIPALAVAVIRDGVPRAAGVAGVRRAGTPDRVQLTDRFHLGSCGKAFTATLAAMLVEESRITWNARLLEVVPESTRNSRTAYDETTLRQLLSHRGGLPSLERPDSDLWRSLLALEGDLPAQRRQMTELAVEQLPAGMPGSTFLYTDLGYAVGGAMLEAATGDAWEDLVLTRIAAPLGITSLGFGAPGGPVDPDEPWGHVLENGTLRAIPPGPGADLASPVIAPAGTIHCSILDWARFAQFHLRGARGEPTLPKLSAEGFRVLHEDLYDQGYALGWAVERDEEGRRTLVHTGTCGAWAAVIWILPDRNLAVVATSNYGGTEAFAACDQVFREILLAPPAGE